LLLLFIEHVFYPRVIASSFCDHPDMKWSDEAWLSDSLMIFMDILPRSSRAQLNLVHIATGSVASGLISPHRKSVATWSSKFENNQSEKSNFFKMNVRLSKDRIW
jgi:hypothetical protein